MPDQIKRLKTFSSIPAHLHAYFPSHLEFNVDPTPVEREVNPSHDRSKRVQFKREIEDSIQKVADITVPQAEPMAIVEPEEPALAISDQFTAKGQAIKNSIDSLFL